MLTLPTIQIFLELTAWMFEIEGRSSVVSSMIELITRINNGLRVYSRVLRLRLYIIQHLSIAFTLKVLLLLMFLFVRLFVLGWIVKVDRTWKHTPAGKRPSFSRKMCKFCPILPNLSQDKSAGLLVQGVCTVWNGEDKCSQERYKRN